MWCAPRTPRRGPAVHGEASTRMAGALSTLPQRIAEVLAIDPTAHAIEFEGEWSTWGDLGATVVQVTAG